jgi:serine/threonine protein phosphatase 1
MRRTLVIGDIHGGLKALKQVLERAKVTQEDKLIFLGDYVDGWSESAQVIAYLIQLNESQECVFVRGNHDVWCYEWLLQPNYENGIWEAHGGKETIASYVKTDYLSQETHKGFFKALKNYHIDKDNRLFLHAGFTSMHGVGKEQYESNYYFDRTLWEASLLAEKVGTAKLQGTPYASKRLSHYKEIYIGHTPTIRYGEGAPMKAYNLWNIDTGAAFTGRLSVLDIDTKEYWQSDALPSLYPNEKGRN